MKLIHTRLARSIWLFDIQDLNPRGKDLLGDLVSWIKDKYSFVVAPDPDNPVPTQPAPPAPVSPQAAPAQAPGGLLFQRGNFQTQEDLFVAINNLTIYDDGIVVDTTSSTNDGDLFAEDLIISAAKEFKLAYDAEIVRRKLYLSELIVRSEMKLESLNPALSAFAEKLPATFAGGRPLPFGVASIAFWSEPNDAGQHRLIRIERQIGKAFSENRFFSDAPLQTPVHFKVLQEFERLVMGG
jgi:hypothetical protein